MIKLEPAQPEEGHERVSYNHEGTHFRFNGYNFRFNGSTETFRLKRRTLRLALVHPDPRPHNIEKNSLFCPFSKRRWNCNNLALIIFAHIIRSCVFPAQQVI